MKSRQEEEMKQGKESRPGQPCFPDAPEGRTGLSNQETKFGYSLNTMPQHLHCTFPTTCTEHAAIFLNMRCLQNVFQFDIRNDKINFLKTIIIITEWLRVVFPVHSTSHSNSLAYT